MNIITGEKLQNLCDYYIGTNEDFKFNPKIANQYNKHININNNDFLQIKQLNITSVFAYTHILELQFNQLYTILMNISTHFNLVFHNSDGCFSNKHLKLFDIKNLNKIFTQNINIKPTDRIIPLGIGIANTMWPHGNLHIWSNILATSDLSIKNNNIYFNFNIMTNRDKRQEVFNIISSKNIQNIPNMDYHNYLKILSSYKFAICPEGNGIDTHRFWECLYLKVIPICLKNNVTEYYANEYPVLLLDNWNDLQIDTILVFYENTSWCNYKSLSFDYLADIIMENVI